MGFQAVLCSSDSALCLHLHATLPASDPLQGDGQAGYALPLFHYSEESLSHIRGAVLASLLLCVEMRVRRALRITLIV